MKKLISLLLIFSLICGCGFSALANNTDANDYQHSALVLDALGILDAENMDPASELTRGEFVKMAVSMLDADSIVASWNGQSPFVDVAADHPYKNHIALAHYLGLVGGYAGSEFRPDAPIAFTEAVKILVSAIGFDEIAALKGGYPGGYLAVAGEQDITDGISNNANGNVSCKDAVIMIHNAMDSEILSDVSYGSEKLYEISEGTTLFTNMLNSRKLTVVEGVVTADSELTFDSDYEVEEGAICIDGERYETGDVNYDNMLGFRVEAYVDQKSRTVKALFKLPDENSELIIDAEDIDYFTTGELGYFASGSDKTQRASINKNGALFMFNGKEVTQFNSEEDLIPQVGSVRLINNGNDSDYDVVIIEEYQSFVVESVATTKQIIYLKKFAGKEVTFNGKPAIYLRDDDSDYISSITDADGKALGISDVKEEDVISVIASYDEKYIKIVVNNKSVKGVLQGIGEDTVTVNGEEYKLNSKNGWDPLEDINLGDTATFYLDIAGKIIMSEIEEKNYNYGYVIKSGTEGTLDKDIMLRIAVSKSLVKVVDENDETKVSYEATNERIQNYTLAENAKVNGVKIKDNDNIDLKNTLIRFTIDKDGNINKIENAEDWHMRTDYFFNPDIPSFGGILTGGFIMDESTNLICIPISGNEDEYYQVVKLEEGNSYDVQAFDVDPETSVAKAAVLKANMGPQGSGAINNTSKVYLVTRVAQSLNADGDECYKVSLLDKSKAIDVEVNTNSDVHAVVAKLKKGYLINYTVDAFGRMNSIKILARPAEYTVPQLLRETQTNEEAYGPLTEVQTNVFSSYENEMVNRITVEYSEYGLEKFYDIPVENPPPVFLFNRSNETASCVSPTDFLSREIVGSDANYVFFAVCEGVVRAVVVFE